MFEIAEIWAGGATLGCAVLGYLYLSTRIDRDEAQAESSTLQMTKDALANRVEVLRGDSTALQKALVDAQREVGRLKAAKVAMKPKRGPNGRFVAKPKSNN